MTRAFFVQVVRLVGFAASWLVYAKTGLLSELDLTKVIVASVLAFLVWISMFKGFLIHLGSNSHESFVDVVVSILLAVLVVAGVYAAYWRGYYDMRHDAAFVSGMALGGWLLFRMRPLQPPKAKQQHQA